MFIWHFKYPYQGVSIILDVLRFQPNVVVQMLESGLRLDRFWVAL